MVKYFFSCAIYVFSILILLLKTLQYHSVLRIGITWLRRNICYCCNSTDLRTNKSGIIISLLS